MILFMVLCLLSINADGATRNPDSYEPNNDAQSASTINFGSVYPTIYPVGDADYFNVSAPTLGTMTVQVTNVPSDINIVLYVYGPNSTTTQRAYANSNSNGGNEYVYFDCAPGYYIIRIYDYGNDNSNTQAYNLTVTHVPVSPDIYEYNNDFANATTISTGSHYPTIFPSNDNDYYNITFYEYGTLTISVSNVPSALNPVVRLYGPNSTSQKAYADSNSYGNSESIYTDIVPGYYYIRVYSYSTSDFSTLKYNLTITFSPFPPDIYEPNNDAQNASTISSGYYYPTIFPTGDVDWYNISFPTMGTLSVSVTNVSSRLDIVIYIYGPNSSTSSQGYADSGSSGSSESIFIQVYQGYYYIKVYSFGNDDFATLAYNLTVKFTPVSPDIYENNDNPQSAYTVSSGSYYPTIFPTGDIDWFNISIETQGTLSVSVTSVSSRLDIVIYIYGPNSSTTFQGYSDSGSSGVSESIYLALQPGYYYIKIYSYGNDDFATSPYTLTINYVAVPPDPWEPNNDFANATLISSGTYTPQIFPKGDMDYFNISCSELGVLYVNVTSVPSSLDIVIRVCGPNSTTQRAYVDSSGAGYSEYLYIDVLPGYYYIQIYSYGNDDYSTLNYTLQISYMPNQPDIFEQNNDFANASLITPGAYYPTIFPTGDKDFFNFSLPSQAKVYINVTQVSSRLDPIIVLYGPNATLPVILTVNSYSSGGSEYLYKELGPGFYYIQIYSSGNDDFSTSPYKLTIETNLPTMHNDAGTGADAGNNFTYATYIPFGNYLGNISDEDVTDYYKFDLLPNEVVYVNFTSPVSGSCYLYIYDSTQYQETSTYLSNSATISIAYSSYQPYFFVRVYRNSGSGTYFMNVTHYFFQNDALSDGDARNNLSLANDPSLSVGSFDGFLCYGDTHDYFVYHLQPNEAVYVNITTSSNLDIYFYMYNSAENIVIGSTYVSPGSSYSVLYSPHDQHFFIRLDKYTGFGTYLISVERWGFQNDASTGGDAGDNFTYASNAYLGYHRGLYCYGDNYDYYVFTISIEQMVWINFTSQNNGSGYIYIYNSSRVEVTNAYSSSGTTKSILFLNKEVIFYVLIQRNSGVGEYYLNITSYGYQNDAGLGADAGNNLTYASSVGNGNYNGMVCYGDTNDYFNFSIAPNEVIFVNVTALTSNLYVYIYDSLKYEVVNRYVTSMSTQSLMYSNAPYFYVRIYMTSGTCEYKLNVTHYCYQNDAALGCDGSNTISGALSILYGSHLGILCFGDDNDYFAINMNAGETVYTNLTAPTTMNLYVYLYNSTNVQLYSGYCPSGSTLSVSQTYADNGVMKIRVYRSSGFGTYALSVTNANTPLPTLSSGGVSPSTGETTTTFTFSVTYTDLSNNPPTYVRVYIDGISYNMVKQNAGDNTYTDGCVYVYSTTLSAGSHNYYFEASNNLGNVRLPTIGTYAGPNVGMPNSSPSLSSGTVSPSNGNTATLFTYTVVYTDVENTAPSYIRVYIDGTSYNMVKQNAGDNTYTDGCVYVYSTTLSAGNHEYYFTASDGSLSARLPDVGVYSGPVVSAANTPPTLTSGLVSPSNAVYGTNVTYSVTYTDAENAAPSSVIVYIDGTIHTMVKFNPADNTYTDGCVYVYWTTTLAIGTHNYYFECSDGQLQARLPTSGTYSGPVINPENVAPVLSSGSVSPSSGTLGTTFTYLVSYSDADNNAPSFIKVHIDGTSYDMVKQNPSDNTYTDGCVYTYTTTLSLGNHNYYFECSDGAITIRLPVSGTYTGPEVLSEPVGTQLVLFSEVMYDPVGTESNEEWFELYNPSSVTVSLTGWYVRDNAGIFFFPSGTSISAASTIVVARNSTAFYARYGFLPQVNGLNLSLSNSGDYLKLYSANGVEIDMVSWENAISAWTCSANENYTISRCPAWVDTNTSSDWVSNSYPSPGEVCTPNSPPSAVLLYAPTSATSSSLMLTWTMNNDNDFARYEIHKSTSPLFTISQNTLVATINVRTTTTYTAIGLASSTTYYFKVRVVDTGALYADSNEVSGTTLGTNTPPTLTNPSVTPLSGTTTDTFTYTVTYYDAENNPPAFVRIYIDDVSANMQKKDILDNTYSDGCVYEYVVIAGLAVGTHSYHFEASDGLQVVLLPPSGAYSGPIVSQPGNNAPVLSSATVTPSSGDTLTTFTFRVTYTDSNDDEPAFVHIIIDGNTYDMAKENNMDFNYADGCVYIYGTTLSAGSHSYYFVTSDTKDYVRYPLNGNFTGPTVSSVGNTAPVLESGTVSPNSGNPTTLFIFSVLYIDADDHAPIYVKVNIDGISYDMTKENTADNVYSDGCVYVYSTYLTPGYHQYRFEASDGIDVFVTGMNLTGLVSSPNNAPYLSLPVVSPSTGTTTTQFVYSVIYYDLDNEQPAYVKVFIDGKDYDMLKEDASDTNYANGCKYVYTTTLSSGAHTYSFLCSDGYSENLTTTYSGPIVVPPNEPPVLSSHVLSPNSGNTSTEFTFSIVYSDANNGEPAYVVVIIDGLEYTMEKATPGDYEYVDGCVYVYRTKLGKGIHTYSFKASDGTDSVIYPEDGILYTANVSEHVEPIKNREPMLLLPMVSPSKGDTKTLFTFRIYYSDPDGTKPAYVRVVIDGKAYEMVCVETGNYKDKVLYEYVTKLAKGKHNHYFTASDGEFVNNTNQISGPNVELKESTPGFSFLLSVCGLAIIAGVILIRKRK